MSHRRRIRKCILTWTIPVAVISVSLLLPSLVLAQTGSLSGTVTDTDGSALPGVMVQLSGELGSINRSVVTDPSGSFSFHGLPVGAYSLVFSASGFEEVRLDGIMVSISGASTLNIEMPWSHDLEMITVMAHTSTSPSWIPACRPPLAPRYRPICYLGSGGYAFNTPPGLHYLESVEVHFRLHPEERALEVKEALEGLGLRGAVEAGTTFWSRCMEAELVETTIDSPLRARLVERNKVEIRPLVEIDERDWVDLPDADVAVKKMGLHPAEWRWRITGVRPGRTHLALRLYAVSVLEKSAPGNPICAPRESNALDQSRRRVETLQRPLAIEVSTARWLDARLPTPWIWSLLAAPAGLLLAWRRRRA